MSFAEMMRPLELERTACGGRVMRQVCIGWFVHPQWTRWVRCGWYGGRRSDEGTLHKMPTWNPLHLHEGADF